MPSNTVINDYNQLISPEHRVTRGSIGINFQGNLPSAVSRVYGFKSGVLISSVTPGFGADKAGLKAGDIITTVDGRSVKDGDDLVNDISGRKPGTTAKVGYLRNGQHLETTVTIGDRAKMIAAADTSQDQEERSGPAAPDAVQSKLGLGVADLPQGAPAGLHGVIIQSVKPGSFADEINLTSAQGYVIVSVNKHPIHNVAEFRPIIAALKPGDDVVFELVDPQRPKGGSSYVGGTLR
jgi:serine protease Do